MIYNADCLTQLISMDDETIDSLITDPPAGISFMNKSWDGDKGGRDQWIDWMTEIMSECLRVMKPGAHGFVWALPRTSHWTATALENAGFEVRDVVTHLFGSGFPKSLDVSKAIDKAAGAEREVVGVHHRHGGGKLKSW
jgi:tRNA G10  N-methylase Trm11